MNKNFFFILVAALLISLTRYPVKLFSFFSFISLIPIYHVLKHKLKIRELILYSFVFASVYNLIVLHWISLVTLGGFIGLFFLFSFYYFILFLLINRVSNIFKSFYSIIFTSFFISFEYLQNFGQFSFPWFNLGYSLSENLTLIQIAEIGGVFFVSLLILIINIILYNVFFSKNRLFYLMIFFILFTLWFGYGKYRLKNLGIKQQNDVVAVVQGNIPLEIKWEQSFFDSTIKIYKDLSLKAKQKYNANLVIWPESAITDYFLKNYKIKKDLVAFAIKHNLNIFSGFEDYEYKPNNKYRKYLLYNAASQIDSSGFIQKPYYKIKLVPFGERMPFLKIFPFLWNFQFGQANFDYGKRYTLFSFKNYHYASLICFEIAFPILTKTFSQNGADFFVNITNDAWFKTSVGTYQHKMMTVFRAIETRKQIFRSANTGYSVVVSPSGRILASTKLNERKIISYKILTYNKKTLFTKYLYLFPFVLTLLNMVSCLYYLKEIITKKG